jgi:cytochrome c oxidase subunit 2
MIRRQLVALIIAVVIASPVLASSAHAGIPLGYLAGFGPKADPVVILTWALTIISALVIVIITGLVVTGVILRRVRGAGANEAIASMQIERSGDGLRWITIGVGVSSVVLLGSLIGTVVVIAAVSGPSRTPAVTIEVTGQQWWWKARYLNDDASQIFVTADEIHIPVGLPVRVKLIGADVIHSFWVPKLTGKMDAIPGQTNETWLEASVPGRYLGQCSEFCGPQHAHMALAVIAEPLDQFKAWQSAQLLPAATVNLSAQETLGEHNLEFHCGACHSVRGTSAGGVVAPDLTHLMSRDMIGGGLLSNTEGNLAGWIADPQSVKPGTLMPNLYLSGPEISSITAFLETLH